VAKYVRKPAALPPEGASPEAGPPADPVDSTHADISEQEEGQHPGRYWGIAGRQNLLWAEVILLDVLPEHLKEVFQKLLERLKNALGITPNVLYLFSKVYLTT
jgi:hypothetical protein